MDTTATAPLEKPRNGLAGLKHWKYDLPAGLMVSLTSLPLSLGIAIASGAPPIAGLMSAIIAGLIFPFLGGAYVTISGPAAGLAPALFAAMFALGRGHLDTGYPLLLAVVCIVGLVQIVLSLLGAAKLSAAFPAAVVEGMLAAIGLMIIAKELPHFIGHSYKAHAFFEYIAETPEEIRQMDPKVFGLGLACLALMFVLSIRPIRDRLRVPPPLAVVLVGLVLGQFLGIDESHRISIPANILEHGIVLPDFPGLFADPSLAWVVATSVLTLVLIDGVESLATIKAIDKVDPFKRKSDPDRTLLSMGVSNICSSLGGGLTIIPGGVKSKLCIVSGGRTLWANFYNACFLIGFLLFGRGLINLIPYSALAAILIHTGYKMCEPKLWRHIYHIGVEQMLMFGVTILATLATDLLVGIFAGLLTKLALNIVLTSGHVWGRDGASLTFGRALAYAATHLTQLFRNPVVRREQVGESCHFYLDRPLVCFNAMHLDRELARLAPGTHEVVMHIGENVAMIDHTSCDSLYIFAEEFATGRSGEVKFLGLDEMRPISHARNGARLARPRAAAATDGPRDGHGPAAAGGADTLSGVQTVD